MMQQMQSQSRIFTKALASTAPGPPETKLWDGDDLSKDRAERACSWGISRCDGNSDWLNPAVWNKFYGDEAGNDLVRPCRYTNNVNLTAAGEIFSGSESPHALCVASAGSVVVFASIGDDAGHMAYRVMRFDSTASTLLSQDSCPCSNDVGQENMACTIGVMESAWLEPACGMGHVPLGAFLVDIGTLEFEGGLSLAESAFEDISAWGCDYSFPTEDVRALVQPKVAALRVKFDAAVAKASACLEWTATFEAELPLPNTCPKNTGKCAASFSSGSSGGDGTGAGGGGSSSDGGDGHGGGGDVYRNASTAQGACLVAIKMADLDQAKALKLLEVRYPRNGSTSSSSPSSSSFSSPTLISSSPSSITESMAGSGEAAAGKPAAKTAVPGGNCDDSDESQAATKKIKMVKK